MDVEQQRTLVRYMLLSVGAAIATIALKMTAAALTGSVGLLSDALESGVNLVAALVALWALRLAGRPPIPIEQFGLGLAISTSASLINLAVGRALLRAGRRHRSLTLVADGKHLLTDVVTSAGVLVGVALVALFDWERLDPIVALVAGLNILLTGYGLIRRSVSGILDAALPEDDLAAIESIIDRYRREGIDFHALRTRESGRQRFVYIHVLVPDEWTVKRGHDVAERFKADLAAVLPGVVTFAHVEPRGDRASYGHDQLHPPVPPRGSS